MRYVSLLLALLLFTGCDENAVGNQELHDVWYIVDVEGVKNQIPIEVTYRHNGEMVTVQPNGDWFFPFEATEGEELYLEMTSDLKDTEVEIQVNKQTPPDLEVKVYDEGRRKVATATL